MKILVLFAFAFVCRLDVLKVNCEVFSSISKLQELAANETQIIAQLEQLADQLSAALEFIESELNEWKQDNLKASKDQLKYVTNPLNAFLMIKRTTSDVEIVTNRLSKAYNTFVRNVKDSVPSKNDLNGAVEGLLRLQTTYNLSSLDLSRGIVDGQQTRPTLSAHDLFVIATTAANFSSHNIPLAREYLEIANQFAGPNETELRKAIKRHLVVLDETQLPEAFEHKQLQQIAYGKVCRGEFTEHSNKAKQLYCRFISFGYFSKISPFKMELLDNDPYIAIYRNAISDDEADLLKSISAPQFNKALVGSGDGGATSDRVAQIAWLYDNKLEIAKRLSQRAQEMTGLSMATAEPLQVQNYGIGGHYSTHHDTFPYESAHEKIRIATLMFYLSDVEMGGATAFPSLNLRILPEKGSAVFWYNIKSSGMRHEGTLHTGCPVLMGSKWVANKWIINYGQEFRKPCKTHNLNESFE